MSHTQILKMNGKPVAVVIPYDQWLKIQDNFEADSDQEAYEQAMADYVASGRRGYPAELVDQLLEGANRIKSFREWRGLTQAKLAQKAEMSVAVLSHLETGVRKAGLKSLRKLSKALDVPLELLADRSEPKK